MVESNILIVGGGLTGLALADRLMDQGRDFHLLEGRDRFGGRIKSLGFAAAQGAGRFDLGPSWFWPGQPLMLSLVERLGLDFYEQYATGLGCFQTQNGRVERAAGYATMRGSLRVAGGMAAVITGLETALPSTRLSIDRPVAALRRGADGVEALDHAGRPLARAQRVALALPPRLAAALHFDPPLPATCTQQLVAIPTWMAGQAKFIAIYERAVWRERGLSGDAMSQCGPLAEVHDATDESTGVPALFGFVGMPVAQRRGNRDALIDAATKQLGKLFGEGAQSPLAVELKDWALDPRTSVAADHVALTGHPEFGAPGAGLDPWDGALLFGATELSSTFGGYLEGALSSAEFLADALR